MAEKTQVNTFSITLADGTSIGGLELNGNNFVSKTEITAEMFRGKLGHVVISGNAEADEAGLIGDHEHMELIQIAHYTQKTHGMPDGWYFALREIPADRLERLQERGDIDYIAMMTGVTL